MLYWVAEQVSQLFGHYMTYRGYCQKNCSGPCTCATNWLSAWGENRALDIEQLMGQARQEISAFQFQHAQDLEAWQRWLWQNHFHQDYLDILHIDDLFWQLLDGVQSRETALKRLPKQVVVFTVLDLPPMQLQFLRRLGQYIDIFILHYNPSQEYWADSVDPLWKQQYDVRVKSRFIEKNPQASDADIAQFLINLPCILTLKRVSLAILYSPVGASRHVTILACWPIYLREMKGSGSMHLSMSFQTHCWGRSSPIF